ncbi:2-polyprenyl-3-methyl-6-methoxy-1,4-benzoquinone monooxygenase [Roseateles koreensis]|uniref:3-demethoxyubiquinol 3-hydroxylase n=1 Tax=Roseateles koreensis TaxID=2987526 RepID=A0ABT5KSZ6_9BURK|nr:2-polyprenyl-3-methyl-6-methoxy-1,4-benzoquinone monooxygenase [Roseateles koreensis]MDC8785468.1 2-polyprenyl-3-methyl-6-methoxy-1,4-benzoquinone monooxygenase [Roseateles koreensis]
MPPFPPPPPLDRLLSSVQQGLHTVFGKSGAARAMPRAAESQVAPPPSAKQVALSSALMRVNHVGEVCAQALYQSQALMTRNPALRAHFAHAAIEEKDHLAWTQQRLDELGGRVSLLCPLWYAGAFGMGCLAGLAGDAYSLGFVVETERQVEQHLASHMDRLPEEDHASRAIVAQMKEEEARHADEAMAAGARLVPQPIKAAMKFAAGVMTQTAHYI